MRPRSIVLLLLIAPLLSGCIYSREIVRAQRAIERQNPGLDFDRKFMFSMGRGSIGGLAEAASFIKEDDVRRASSYMRNLSKVKVGVFEIEGDYTGEIDVSRVPHLRRGQWQTLARFEEEEGDNVAVLYRERYGEVRDLFIVALSRPELVVVRLTGNFTDILVDAMADYSEKIPRLGLFDDDAEADSTQAID